VTRSARVTGSAVVLVALLVGQPSGAGAAGWPASLAGGSAGHSTAGTLPAPTGVTGICGTGPNKTSVIVGWSAVTRATSYTILESTTSSTGTFTAVATGVTGTSWTSPALANNTTHWYKVQAVTGNWSGPQSAPTTQRTISGNSCV
jgi:hypothetical protein